MEYGCIGEKLTHSFSAEIHAKIFDYKYELLEIEKEKLPEFMRSKNFKAINVTIPYKKDVIPFLDVISEQAEKIGAVNTVVNKDGRLYGFNTDFAGMKALIEYNRIEIKGKKVLILGSGGTSATALAVAKALGARQVFRVSRTKREGFITYPDAQKLHNDAQVIINTTPCGMYPHADESPVDIDLFKKVEAVVDAIYNPLRTTLVSKAKAKGINAVCGLYMLIAQAVFAAEKFTDTSIPTCKIDEIYKMLCVQKENIVLIGMPSSGKSTIGKILAKELNMNFIDTDSVIVEKTGKQITEIFENSSEEEFRRLEAETVKEISSLQNTVIATGGGAVLNPKNTEYLKQNGRIYFLDRPLEKLIVTSDRPLSSDREKLKRRYDERYELYCSAADVRIQCDDSINKNVSLIKEDFLK